MDPLLARVARYGLGIFKAFFVLGALLLDRRWDRGPDIGTASERGMAFGYCV